MLKDNALRASSWDSYHENRGRIIEIDAIIGMILALKDE
jgi:hypothetical protein